MWNNIKFNSQQIETEADKAFLIKMPNNSRYKGYKFWHPNKLIREMDRGKGYWLSLSFTDDWEFKLFRGKHETVVTADKFIESFEPQQEGNSESYVKVEEPKKIDLDVEVDESLKR